MKNSTHAPKSLHGGGSHSALRVCSQTGVRVAFLLPCPALLQNCLVSIFGYCSADLRCTEMSSSVVFFFQLLVLDCSDASGCTSAGLQLVPPHILPPKIKHGPVSTRRKVHSSLLSARLGNVTVSYYLWFQYRHCFCHGAVLTLSLYMYAFVCSVALVTTGQGFREASASPYHGIQEPVVLCSTATACMLTPAQPC